MIYIFELYYALLTVILAEKDGVSFLLKNNNADPITLVRLKRWHKLSVTVALVPILPYLFFDFRHFYEYLIAAFFIRLTFFNIIFSSTANMPLTYVGRTAKTDQWIINIFGPNGEVVVIIISFILLIGLNLLKIFVL